MARCATGPPAAPRSICRAEGPVLLNIGTLRPYKNIEGLIDAFGALPEEKRGTLLIAGAAKSAAYAEELRRRAAAVPGVVLRAEFIADEALPSYLAAADIVVLPYRSLLTSGILLWALSYARPVVAPAFGPVHELVGERANRLPVHAWRQSPRSRRRWSGRWPTLICRRWARPDWRWRASSPGRLSPPQPPSAIDELSG